VSSRSIIQQIHQLIVTVRENEVTQVHECRAFLRIRPKYVELTDTEKLKCGWCCCPACDQLVRNMSRHRGSDVCRRTKESKKLSVTAADSQVDE
jgi:hypothetical protein